MADTDSSGWQRCPHRQDGALGGALQALDGSEILYDSGEQGWFACDKKPEKSYLFRVTHINRALLVSIRLLV
jgi:hypothetical protein